ncbi:hypothetical protein [Idiomarina sp.]|uniref:hypothetical protein n=1 Tax=Idiomarina sp. TaxID=1874361 RepID=UPI003A8F5D3C
MLIPKDHTKTIFSTKIPFRLLIDFVRLVKKKEEQHQISCHIILKTENGETYIYQSATEALAEETEDNLKTHNKRKVTEFILRVNDRFNIYIWSNGRAQLTTRSGDELALALSDIATLTLNLRTKKSWIVSIIDSKLYAFLGGVPPVVAFLQLEPNYPLGLAFALTLFLMHLLTTGLVTKYESSNRIVMENGQDSFVIRNRDSIVISSISGFIGLLIGYFVSCQ